MSEKNLSSVLIKIQKDLVVPKTEHTKNYDYRTLDKILEELKPHLVAHEALLTISDEVIFIGEEHYIKSTVTLSVGSESISVSALAREAGKDNKFMSPEQKTGSASTYARKTALGGLFLLDDNTDPDNKDEQKERADNDREFLEKAACDYVENSDWPDKDKSSFFRNFKKLPIQRLQEVISGKLD
jgi:stringent starvation protein B